MDKIILNITEDSYASAKEARKANRIPVIYYGKDIANHSFSVDYQEFRRVYNKGGKSTIIYFKNDKGEELAGLIHDIQYHPVTDMIIHIDCKAVNMGVTITAEVPLILEGTAPVVKEQNGVLIQNKDSIEIECLPKDLLHEILVDVSTLEDFHHSISVKDLKVPSGIKILDNEDITVVTVSAPRAAIEENVDEENVDEEASEAKEGKDEKAE